MARPVDLGKGSPVIVLASICIVVAALYFAQDVLIPVALAVLVAYLLNPIASRLERWRMGRLVSVVLVVFLALCVIVLFGWIVKNQFIQVADRLPSYRLEIRKKIERVRASRYGLGEAAMKVVKTVREVSQSTPTRPAATSAAGPAQRKVRPPSSVPSGPPKTGPMTLPPVSPQNPLPVRNYPSEPAPLGAMADILEKVVHPLLTAGIVIVFAFFMLLYREDLRDRIIRLVSGQKLTLTIQIVDEATKRISHYLLAQSIINSFYGFSIGLGLWIIGQVLGAREGGFPNVLLWGLLAGVFRFIPYIGPWIGAAFPLLLAFGTFPDNRVLVAVLLLFVGLELLVSQFIEPFLYSSSTGVSTMAILVAALFWASIWGPVGLLLSTPLTVMLAVLGRYVPPLNFLYILLGDEPVLEPHERLYQRLVAFDHEEALDLVRELLATRSLEDLYDTVFLPALVMAAEDRHRGQLDEERYNALLQGLKDLIEELGDQERPKLSAATAAIWPADQARPLPHLYLPPGTVVNVLDLPAKDEADEVAALMLAQFLELRGYRVRVPPAETLAAEKIALLEEYPAHIIAVSAVPPNPIVRARYLCKRILDRYPDRKIVVGLWTFKGDLARAGDRLAPAESLRLATTLRQAQEEIDRVTQTYFLSPSP